ncbi:response regulator transcription factor [Deinococcus sp.]|uniref:response regulator transcription factor n=1 Tax=Deinococcus sp. TaxID=47478 RepID=UPI002869A7BB|nr:response regulator transcription factor [Deinococcus sp.]
MRLLLVEDDPRVAALVIEGLGEDSLTVDHAPDAATAEGLCALRDFDLLIVDVMLPEGPHAGFELARTLRARHDRTPILFLTARGDLDSRVTGLDTGGDDYLTKPFEFRELRARIRALVRRSVGEASNTLPLPLGYRLDLAGHQVLRDGHPVALTPREYALVECLGLSPGRAYARDSLIERVWPEDSAVDTKVVDVFVSTVRRKLGDSVIETVRGLGYRLGPLQQDVQA